VVSETDEHARSETKETPGENKTPGLSDSELRALAERVLHLLKEDARIERERLGARRPGLIK
jgi:hypothetical protein